MQNPKNAASQSRLSLRNKLLIGSAIDEREISNPPGLLIFEYFAHDLPFGREPLADKACSKLPLVLVCSCYDICLPPYFHRSQNLRLNFQNLGHTEAVI